MDFFEVRNLSRTSLSKIDDKGLKGEDVLFWCSQLRYVRPVKNNSKESISIKRHVFRKYNIDGVFLSQYDSIEQAAKEINVKPVTINKGCRGLQVVAGGFQWRKCASDSIPENIAKVEDRIIPSGPRSVYQIDFDGVIIKKHESITAASKEVGVDPKNIRAVLKGIQKKAGGYYWDYA